MHTGATSRGRPLRHALSATVLVAALTVTGLGQAPAYAREAAVTDAVLADFEGPDPLRGVSLAAPTIDRVDVTGAFATAGSRSLRLGTAPFSDTVGAVVPRVYLDNGTALAAADWRQYAYLHVGVLNATIDSMGLNVVVRDSAGHFVQRGLSADPFTYRMFQIKVADLTAAGVDVTQVRHVEVNAARSGGTKTIYVDDVRLTNTAASEAAEQERTAPQVVRAMDLPRRVSTDTRRLDEVARRIPAGPLPSDRYLRDTATALRRHLNSLDARIPEVANDLVAARQLRADLDTTWWRIQRLDGFVDARHARPHSPVGITFADSTSLVYPRDLPCPCDARPERIGLARGEYESIQLAALPYGTGLSGATVRVARVRGPGSGVTATAHPVASLDLTRSAWRPTVATRFRPAVYQSWTPDPILTDRSTVDVAGDDTQAFWVQLHASRTSQPGLYTVDLELSAANVSVQRASVQVNVWNVTIADRPVLATAVGHNAKFWAAAYDVTDPEGIARLNDAKFRFLTEFKIQPDNIYRSLAEPNPPTVADLREIQQRYGGLRRFNVWYFDPRLFNVQQPDTWDAQADVLFDRIQPYVDSYREAGLVDHAYMYCCDETRAEYTELIKQVLTRFKARFGDIEVMSVHVDNQMGETTGLSTLMDLWVRDVPWLSPDIIARRHAAGDEAWWYLHAGNYTPYPNFFVGYSPGQLRTLLGPMAFQAKVDGFLYYRVDRLQGQKVLTDGPLSTWDPRTWNDVAGDGSLMYPGRNGPMPSIRIQNFRDGMEDHNLLAALRHAVDTAPDDADPHKLALARHLLTARDVVTNQTTYVRDAGTYQHWRAQVAAVLQYLT